MSRIFGIEEKGSTQKESVDNYQDLFLSFVSKNPTLVEAIDQLYKYKQLDAKGIEEQRKKVIETSNKSLEKKLADIQKAYPNIKKAEALIIFTYTYEDDELELTPYQILNQNLVSENRREGVKRVSKYLFILLKALRKLPRFNANGKYLFRAIKPNVNQIQQKVEYKEGNIRKFWGFTSTSKRASVASSFLKDGKNNIKEGTKYYIHGEIIGYDISLFSCFPEEEVLLEPEREYKIEEVEEFNKVVNVYCEVLKTKVILENIIKPEKQNNTNLNVGDFLPGQGKVNTILKLNSCIINNLNQFKIVINKLKKFFGKDKITFNLLYRVTKDGDKIQDFYKKCGNKHNTLIIVKTTNNYIFGGFTTQTWENRHMDKEDDNAFCFSLDKNKIYEAVKGSNSIFFYPGKIFGFFWFIDIKESSLINGGSDHTPWSKGYYEGITNKNFELNNGSESFNIIEIETFQIS